MKRLSVLVLLLTLTPMVIGQSAANNTVPAEEKRLVIDTIAPSDLDISEVTFNNTEVVRVGTSYSIENKTSKLDIQNALEIIREGEDHQKFMSIIDNVLNKSVDGLDYETELQVYEIKSVYANVQKTAYRTKRTISVSIDKEFENLWIVDVLDRDIARNISQISFVEPPQAASEDPVSVIWRWDNVSKGANISVSYFVHDIVVGDEDNKLLAVGNAVKEGGEGIKAPEEFREDNDGNRTFIEDKLHDIGVTFSNNILFFSVVAGVLIVLGILIMELESRNKFEFLKDWCRDCIVISRVGFKNRGIMQNYVNECLNDGHHLEDIRVSLMRAGWDRKAVRTLLRKYK